MKFLYSKLLSYSLILFLIIGIFSCGKPITIKNVIINGPTAVCYGDSGVIYFVPPNPDPQSNDYILWTVPDQAQIISGQGKDTIKVDFGRYAGKIGVKYYSDGEEISEESFIDVSFDVKNQWCRELDFKGGNRVSAVAFSIGNKGYIGTGVVYGSTPFVFKDFWEFDPFLKTWTQKANVGGINRIDAVGFSIGNKGYIGTGTTGTGTAPSDVFKDFWEYDPGTNIWSQKADCGSTSRFYAVGFSIGNKGYIGSGKPALTGVLTDFLEFDPDSNKWVGKADIIVPRFSAVGFSIGSKGYFGLGAIGGVYNNDFFEFDPSDISNGFDVNGNPLGKWSQKNSFPGAARIEALGFSMGDKGYVGTGHTTLSPFFYNDLYEYDPISGNWNNTPIFFTGDIREKAIGFSIDNKAYIGTGSNESPILKTFNDFWVYTK